VNNGTASTITGNGHDGQQFNGDGMILNGTGAIVHFAPIKDMPKAGGKWNVYDITARGPRITVLLNGTRTVELNHDQFKSGPIALQYGAGVVRFRKVQIRPL
jgi:hypothetical protein